MGFLETLSANRGLTVLILGPLLLIALLLTFARVKRVSPVSWGWFGPINSTKGLAIQGFDPVVYRSGRAAAGNARWSHAWQGSTWHFASRENLELFTSDPERYAPQFGGFCAFAISKGFTAGSDPQVFAVEDDKTYLFDSEGVRRKWLAQLSQGVIDNSQANWTRH